MFRFQTNNVNAMCSLMYGLQELVDTARFKITSTGITLSESACQNNLYIYANFSKDRFMAFETSEEITICFIPKHIYKILNTSTKTWEMTEWSYNKKKADTLIISRVSGEYEETFEIKLPKDDSKIYKAPRRLVNYLLLFNSGMFVNIISNLYSISKEFRDDWLTIKCTPKYVQFYMENGFTVGHARITLKTDLPDEESHVTRRSKKTNDDVVDKSLEIDDKNQTVKHEYKLQHLYQMLNCFSLTNGSILMYVSKDYPIVFEMKVGTLGILKATLMFKDDDDEDEYMYDENEEEGEEILFQEQIVQ